MTDTKEYAPINAATGNPIDIDMQELKLTGTILPFGAKIVSTHIFRSNEADPIEVVYSFGLPKDGSMTRFFIKGEDFCVESELDPVKKAEEKYESGIKDGSLSALAKTYQDGVVNLCVGNIRPHETVAVQVEMLVGLEVRDNAYRFRFPLALGPRYHAQAHNTINANDECIQGLPTSKFGDVVLPKWTNDESGLHRVGFEFEIEEQGLSVFSPTHPIKVKAAKKTTCVSNGAAIVPDRDLVITVERNADEGKITWAGMDEKKKCQFACVVPSGHFGKSESCPRSVMFVLDRSGSMTNCIEQAKQATIACLSTLTDKDEFGIVIFDDTVDHFSDRMMSSTAGTRQMALQWLNAHFAARGGTNTANGIRTAAQIIENSSKKSADIFLITDGEVWGCDEVIKGARSSNKRIHILGLVESGTDRWLAQMADAAGGVCRSISSKERADIEAIDMFASIGRPTASNIHVECDNSGWVSNHPSSVFSGTPLVLFGSCSSKGCKMKLTFEDGCGKEKTEIVQIAPKGSAETASVAKLIRGSRLISQAEASTTETVELEKKLSRLAEEYGLTTKTHALVAVVKRDGDRSGIIPNTKTAAVGIVKRNAYFGGIFGCSGGGISGYSGYAGTQGAQGPSFNSLCCDVGSVLTMDCCSLYSSSSDTMISSNYSTSATLQMDGGGSSDSSCEPSMINDDLATKLSMMIDDDGGIMHTQKILASAYALIFFVNAGNTDVSGPFRAHVQRLKGYLEIHASDKYAEKALEYLVTAKNSSMFFKIHVDLVAFHIIQGEQLCEGILVA